MRSRMTLKDMARHWTLWGRQDPFWAVLTTPGKENNRWNVDEFMETGCREINQLVEYAQSRSWALKRERALDFGCGVGRLTQALADHFSRVDGVDISASMIERARQINRQGDRCQYHLNEKDELSLFPDKAFDWVNSSITLQHIDPVFSRRYLAELVRVLAPGGLLVFQLPSRRTGDASFSTEPQKDRDRSSSRVKRFRKQISRVYYGLMEAGQNVRIKWHYRWRALLGKPLIYMYGLPCEEVMRILEQAGGRVLEVCEDQRAGREWLSLQYFVTRVDDQPKGGAP